MAAASRGATASCACKPPRIGPPASTSTTLATSAKRVGGQVAHDARVAGEATSCASGDEQGLKFLAKRPLGESKQDRGSVSRQPGWRTRGRRKAGRSARGRAVVRADDAPSCEFGEERVRQIVGLATCFRVGSQPGVVRLTPALLCGARSIAACGSLVGGVARLWVECAQQGRGVADKDVTSRDAVRLYGE